MDGAAQGGERRDMRQVGRRYLMFYLRVYDGMSNKILGHLVDISEKGVMLICDEAIPVNAAYRLRMRLPTQMKERSELLFNAVCKWSRVDANPDFCLAGFFIEELEPINRDLITSLIEDFGYRQER
jgi:PilZ domain